MKIGSFKKINENYLAVVLTLVLFFLLFLLKLQEDKVSLDKRISNSPIELASSDN